MATKPTATESAAHGRRRVSLLLADPDLADGLDEDARRLAERSLPAPAAVLETGPWDPAHSAPAAGHIGFLVMDGLLVRRVEVGEGGSAELLGPGDLLRPWQEDASSFCTASWEVLERTTLALLEPPLARQLSHWPVVVANVVARGVRRSRRLAAHAALARRVGVEDRILVLLWQLAETWGRTDADGVHLELRLPHRVIADLVGARRPSVSSGLGALQREGRVEGLADGSWRLLGEPPPY